MNLKPYLHRLMTAFAVLLLAVSVLVPPAYAFKQSDLDILQSTKKCPACDLSGVTLSNVDLSGAVLRDANLTGADLTGVILTNASLARTNLSQADLTNATLLTWQLLSMHQQMLKTPYLLDKSAFRLHSLLSPG